MVKESIYIGGERESIYIGGERESIYIGGERVYLYFVVEIILSVNRHSYHNDYVCKSSCCVIKK